MTLEGLDHRIVLVGGRGDPIRVIPGTDAIEGLADARMVDQKPVQARHQIGRRSHDADLLVEAMVLYRRLRHASLRDRVAIGALNALQFVDGFGRCILCRQPRDRRVNHRRGLEELAHRREIHRRHLRTAVLLQHEIAFAGQSLDHFAQRRARNPEGFGEIGFVEQLPRRDLHGKDALPQGRCGFLLGCATHMRRLYTLYNL